MRREAFTTQMAATGRRGPRARHCQCRPISRGRHDRRRQEHIRGRPCPRGNAAKIAAGPIFIHVWFTPIEIASISANSASIADPLTTASGARSSRAGKPGLDPTELTPGPIAGGQSRPVATAPAGTGNEFKELQR